MFAVVADPRKAPGRAEVIDNLRSYVRQVFRTTVGHVRVDQPAPQHYLITIEVEGPPAHDPDYRAARTQHFADRFVAGGFGPTARLVKTEVGILAGDTQDGRPPTQLIVLPRLPDLAPPAGA